MFNKTVIDLQTLGNIDQIRETAETNEKLLQLILQNAVICGIIIRYWVLSSNISYFVQCINKDKRDLSLKLI